MLQGVSVSAGGGVGASPPVSGTVSHLNVTMRYRIRFRNFSPDRKPDQTSGAIMAAFILTLPLKEVWPAGRAFAALTATINGQRWQRYWEYLSQW